jgi:hypothetical protein
MTRKEAIQANIPVEVSDSLIEKMGIDTGLDLGVTYALSDLKQMDLIIADICQILVAQPDVTEGSLAVRHARESLIGIRNAILLKYADDQGGLTTQQLW